MEKTIKYTYIAVIIDLLIAVLMLDVGRAESFEDTFSIVYEEPIVFSSGMIPLLFFTYYIGKKIHYFIFEKGYNFIIIMALGLYFIAVLGI